MFEYPKKPKDPKDMEMYSFLYKLVKQLNLQSGELVIGSTRLSEEEVKKLKALVKD